MPRPHRHASWRDRLPGRRPEPHFRRRGREVSRIEGLADAVFAFTVTLLVVALEVPESYAGLRRVVESFPAFVATFALLMTFWNAHYTFFRRYGLEDAWTRTLNAALMLLVLFSAYPLKFLFSSWFAGMFGLGHFDSGIRTLGELSQLYVLYGCGLAGIWAVFGLLYFHAYRQRERLALTPVERILTRSSLWEFGLSIGVAGVSIALALAEFSQVAPGFVYALLGVAMPANAILHGRMVERELAAAGPRGGAGFSRP